jgi:hypothetical protein
MIKFFSLLLLPLFLFSFSWDYSHEFVLKKDQLALVEVLKREDSSKRVLAMRWTLFQNERLVLLVNYDGFPTQYIVQKKYKRNSIKIALRDDYHDSFKQAIMIVTFKAFDDAKKTALLKVSVSDPNKQIEITFIDPEKNKG